MVFLYLSSVFFVKADRIHLWATTQTHTCTLQKWTSCRVTVVSKFWSPVNEEAKAKQMAQKKASSSRCLGFPFGMWNIAQRTGYLASVRTLDPMLQGSDHHIKGYDIKGVFGVDTQHSAPGKPAVPKGKADKVGAFRGNRGEFLLFSWPLCRSLKLQRNPLKHIETWFRPLGALGI